MISEAAEKSAILRYAFGYSGTLLRYAFGYSETNYGGRGKAEMYNE